VYYGSYVSKRNCRICTCISRTFWPEFALQNWGAAYARNIMSLLTTEPATPVLYVVKLPVETASVWDCYLASYCTRAIMPMLTPVYRHIFIFIWEWLAPSIPRSQKTVTSLTNYCKCCQWQPKCRECNCKYFTSTKVKSSADVRVVIISKFMT
jgi:hypothetical protein